MDVVYSIYTVYLYTLSLSLPLFLSPSLTHSLTHILSLSHSLTVYSILLLLFIFFLLSFIDFAMSYAERGEILSYLKKLGSFDEQCTQFYSSELVLALEYMKSRKLVHRFLFFPSFSNPSLSICIYLSSFISLSISIYNIF